MSTLARPVHRPTDDGEKRRRRAITLGPAGWTAYVVILMLAFEAASRLVWVSSYRVSFLHSVDWIHAFYPELRGVIQKPPTRGDDTLDVLLLGGSVLAPEWSTIAAILEERLRYDLRRQVAVHNLARPGHTSLDSFRKYSLVSGARFDLVVLYDGVNDVRANNCPDDVFRADYTHFSWYKQIHAYENAAVKSWITLPLTARHLSIALQDLADVRQFVPRERPRPEWMQYGSHVKTAEPFRRNVAGVARLARERGDPLIMCTFAHYIPGDYTRQRFDARALDYTKHSVPIELWGLPANVAAALGEHNRILQDVARASGTARLVDQNGSIPKSGAYFNDMCHLTHRGSDHFVENLLQAIKYRVAQFASVRSRL